MLLYRIVVVDILTRVEVAFVAVTPLINLLKHCTCVALLSTFHDIIPKQVNKGVMITPHFRMILMSNS